MTKNSPIRITAAPGELEEGLFGGVFVFVFEILPYLRRRGVFPSWSVASLVYGEDPDCIVIPGVLDLAYTPQPGPAKQVRLLEIKSRHNVALGSDWPALHALWSAYFQVPSRVIEAADAQGDLGATLGIHYRGGDKNTATWDSNAVSHDEFLSIVQDFLKRRPGFTQLFAATDDHAFVGRLREATGLPTLNLGAVRFHKGLEGQPGRAAEADRALLDCVLLSRCGVVLSTSSALSAFAKVFNPKLEIYRSAASKMYSDIPYFPVAYIPVYETDDPKIRAVLHRTMNGDWTQSEKGRRYRNPFTSMPRHPVRTAVWSLTDLVQPLV